MKSLKTILKWLIGILLLLSLCGAVVYFAYMILLANTFANTFWGSVDDWSIEDQPWHPVSIPIPDKNTEVIYQEKHAHPFLAEFVRQIEIRKDGVEPVILGMPMNTGGDTLINVYSNSNLTETKTLILKDRWGSYILHLDNQELEVDSSGTIPDASQYIGRIEYDQSSELTFLSADEAPEMIIESTE